MLAVVQRALVRVVAGLLVSAKPSRTDPGGLRQQARAGACDCLSPPGQDIEERRSQRSGCCPDCLGGALQSEAGFMRHGQPCTAR